MPYESLIDTAWKFYEVALLTTEILGWGGLIIGAIGLAVTKTKPTYHQRSKALACGGAAALGAVLLAGEVYKAVTFVMTDKTEVSNYQTALYPDLFLQTFSNEMLELVTLAGVFAQVAAVIGMAAFVFGAGLWGITARGSYYRGVSNHTLAGGFSLMMISVGERIFAAVAYIFLSFLV